jgi:CBS domain containing-hemolysin-like protein
MNFTITWIMDKFGYIPKPAIKINLQEWSFPAPKEVKPTKKVAKKTVKIPKATTRKTTKK